MTHLAHSAALALALAATPTLVAAAGTAAGAALLLAYGLVLFLMARKVSTS